MVALVTAVRMGALNLGVGNIIGRIVLDTLMIALADVCHVEVRSAATPARSPSCCSGAPS